MCVYIGMYMYISNKPTDYWLIPLMTHNKP